MISYGEPKILFVIKELILNGALSILVSTSPKILSLSFKLNFLSAMSISIFALVKNETSISSGLDLYSFI